MPLWRSTSIGRHRADCEAGHSGAVSLRRIRGAQERLEALRVPYPCLRHSEGKFSRKSTGLTDWDQARELLAHWKSWNGELLIPPSEPSSRLPFPGPHHHRKSRPRVQSGIGRFPRHDHHPGIRLSADRIAGIQPQPWVRLYRSMAALRRTRIPASRGE